MHFFNRYPPANTYAPFVLTAMASAALTLLMCQLKTRRIGHDWNEVGQKSGQLVVQRSMDDYIALLASAQHELVQIPRYVGQWLREDNVVLIQLKKHLADGKKLKVITLDPSSEEAKLLPAEHRDNLVAYIRSLLALRAVYPTLVEIRCTPRFLPYAMDMIDGDLDNEACPASPSARLNLHPKPTREPHQSLPSSLTQDPVNQQNTWIFPLVNVLGTATPFKSYRIGARAAWHEARVIASEEDIQIDIVDRVIALQA